jgi:hypothetical protein
MVTANQNLPLMFATVEDMMQRRHDATKTRSKTRKKLKKHKKNRKNRQKPTKNQQKNFCT